MRVILLVASIAVVLGMTAIAPAEDLLKGFAGLPWGVSIEAVQDVEESARSGDIRYYRRPGDAYTIAGVALSDVVYGFYRGQYFAAYLNVPSPEAFDTIKTHLGKTYGKPRAQLRVGQTVYIWDYLDAKIKLKQYRDRTKDKLAFYFVPLSTEANRSRSNSDAVTVYDLDAMEPDFGF